MAPSNSPDVELLDSTELRGTLANTVEPAREGAQHPEVHDFVKKAQALRDRMRYLKSPDVELLDSTELRGTLDNNVEPAREGAQHLAVQSLQASSQDPLTKLQAAQAELHYINTPPIDPASNGYGPHGLPWESLEPRRRYLELLNRLCRWDGEFPLNMVDGVDTLVLDAKTKADFEDRLGAFIASLVPNHPFVAALEKKREGAEGGVESESEAQQDKQSVSDLASNGKDHTHDRLEEASICTSWLIRSNRSGPAT
jgi:hypothetical protein